MGGSIQFAKDDKPIILDSGCAHCQLDISNEGQASLTINRVSSRDQGRWQCWRLDAKSGAVLQRIPVVELVVTNSPELPILIVNDKELQGGGAGNTLDSTISVKENELITFRCLIKGASSPIDYVHWMLDSTQNITHLSQLMMEYSSQDSKFLTQSVLKLNATKAMNLKSVSCLANHHLWMMPMTVTAFLNVLYEPSFTISREPGFGIPVTEGMSVTLKCEIDSNPSSPPIWIRDADANATSVTRAPAIAGQQQQVSAREPAPGEPVLLDTREDGSVVFEPAQRSDSGWYRCKTENKYGNFSSFGYYLNVNPAPSGVGGGSNTGGTSTGASGASQPQVANNGALTGQATSSQARQATGQPLGEVAPMLPPASAVASANKVRQPNQAPASYLAQANPRPALARAQMASMLNQNDQPALAASPPGQNDYSKCPTSGKPIDGAPEIRNPISQINGQLGRQLILPLKFCCQPGPARVFWVHRHLAMVPGRMFGPYITRDIYTSYSSPHCYESTFEIEAVKPEDIGTVYVFVANERGLAEAQINIQLPLYQRSERHPDQIGSRFSLQGSNSNSAASGSQSTPLMLPLVLLLSTVTLLLRLEPLPLALIGIHQDLR